MAGAAFPRFTKGFFYEWLILNSLLIPFRAFQPCTDYNNFAPVTFYPHILILFRTVMLRKTLSAVPLLLVIAVLTMGFKKHPSKKGRPRVSRTYVSCYQCSYKFDDGVDKHREVTRNSTLKTPPRNLGHIRQYVADSQLAPINNGNGYLLAKMTYSYPYLTVKSVDFLEELGQAYREACKKKGVPYRPFVITSALRTYESVARLTRVNRNAIKESAHLYGTTFDISWRGFGAEKTPSQKNLNVLIAVLEDFREAGACYVKYERQQACFHITVNENNIQTLIASN
jgi:hypothetical protein